MTSLQGKRAVIAVLVAVSAVAVAGAATLSDMLSQQPVIAPEATQEEPATPAGFSVVEPKSAGCWEVTLGEAQLDARWVRECAPGSVTEVGPRAWRAETLRLPAPAGVQPLMTHAHVHAVLSADLAQRGEGALLFLPTSATGAGFYVAGWAAPARGDDDTESETESKGARGVHVGVYGAPPASVMTHGGRVYLQPDFAPSHALARNSAQELEPAPAPDAAEHDAGDSPAVPEPTPPAASAQ